MKDEPNEWKEIVMFPVKFMVPSHTMALTSFSTTKSSPFWLLSSSELLLEMTIPSSGIVSASLIEKDVLMDTSFTDTFSLVSSTNVVCGA